MYLTELFVIAGAVVFIYLYRNYKGDDVLVADVEKFEILEEN